MSLTKKTYKLMLKSIILMMQSIILMLQSVKPVAIHNTNDVVCVILMLQSVLKLIYSCCNLK